MPSVGAIVSISVVIVFAGLFILLVVENGPSSNAPEPLAEEIFSAHKDKVSSLSLGPQDASNQYGGHGDLWIPYTGQDFFDATGCDPLLVPASWGACTAFLVDTDYFMDEINAVSPGFFSSSDKDQVRRRWLGTAAHCAPLSFAGAVNDQYTYPMDDPNVYSHVGFRFDMDRSPGRIMMRDVPNGTCAIARAPTRTVNFLDYPGFPLFDTRTAGIAELNQLGSNGHVFHLEGFNYDVAYMVIAPHNDSVDSSIVADQQLVRINSFPAKVSNALLKANEPLISAGYGIYPGGDPAKDFLGNPHSFINNTFTNRSITQMDVLTVTETHYITAQHVAQGTSAICNGDSGGPLGHIREDGYEYVHGVTSTGIGNFCRGQSQFARIDTKQQRDYLKRTLRAFIDGGLPASQQIRVDKTVVN